MVFPNMYMNSFEIVEKTINEVITSFVHSAGKKMNFATGAGNKRGNGKSNSPKQFTKREIRNALEARYSKFTEQELFGSHAFQELLQSYITSVCYEKNRIPTVDVEYDPQDHMTACTDGMEVFVNAGNELVTAMKDLWEKYVSTVGFATHESGHVLYTDFVIGTRQLKAWESGAWYPANKSGKSLMDIPAGYRSLFVREMQNLQNILEDIYIENCLYAELGGLATIGLTQLNDTMYSKSTSLDENVKAVCAGNRTKEAVVMQALLNRKSGHAVKRDTAIAHDTESQAVLDEVLNAYDDIAKIVDEFEYETSAMIRASLIQDIVVRLMDLLPDENQMNQQTQQSQSGQSGQSGQQGQQGQSCQQVQSGSHGNQQNQNSQNQNSQNSSSQSSQSSQSGQQNQQSQSGQQSPQNQANQNSDGSSQESGSEQNQSSQSPSSNSQQGNNQNQQKKMSESDAQKLAEQIKKELEKSGMTRMPKGHTRSVEQNSKEEKKESAEDQKKTSHDNLKNVDSMESMLKKAIRDVIKAQIEDAEEDERIEEMTKQAKEMEHQIFPGGNNDYPRFVIHREKTKAGMKTRYAKLYATQKKSSDHLYKKLNNILTDRAQESSDSGYLMGNKFNAKDLWHGDGAVFSRTQTPDGKPNVVFGILCDESGSMAAYTGDCQRCREDVVRDTAIMLEDVLRRLDVPVCIVGHTTSGTNVRLHPYVDFDKRTESDKYQLANITSYNNNIDGAAITYLAEKMVARPERNKILIVISDGQPCDGSYYSSDPIEDTKKAIEKYRKSGIKILGAMLVDDKEAADIYGDGNFFDCVAPQRLEKELIKIVKKYVLL